MRASCGFPSVTLTPWARSVCLRTTCVLPARMAANATSSFQCERWAYTTNTWSIKTLQITHGLSRKLQNRLSLPTLAFFQVVNVEKPDSSSRALTVCVRGKRALRFSEVRDYQRLANTIRSRCGISASPQHSASSEVTYYNCRFIEGFSLLKRLLTVKRDLSLSQRPYEANASRSSTISRTTQMM